MAIGHGHGFHVSVAAGRGAVAMNGIFQHYTWNRARRYVRAMRAVIGRYRHGTETGSAGTGSTKLPTQLLDSALERGERSRSSHR